MKTGLSKSFTKKGPGRIHDYSGVAVKCKGKSINQEWAMRMASGCLTETFRKKWVKHYKRYSKNWAEDLLSCKREFFKKYIPEN